MSTPITRRAWTPDQALATVRASLETHHDTIAAFHDAFYHNEMTWKTVTWRGVPVLKNPMDLWNYGEVIHALKPRTIIETGTAFGGSALWFADTLQAAGIAGRVLTIDTAPAMDFHDRRIEAIVGSSLDPAVLAQVTAGLEAGPVLVSLDSDHTEAHVRAELAAYAPFVPVGSMLVVEDTNVVFTQDAGPAAAAASWLATHPNWRRDIWAERFMMTFFPGGWLQRAA